MAMCALEFSSPRPGHPCAEAKFKRALVDQSRDGQVLQGQAR
jgi:hypothetical protein